MGDEDDAVRSSSRRSSSRAKPLKRRRDGCMNCRRKKRKCDRLKPQCTGCQKTKERCQWNQPLKFRPENALTLPDTPDTVLADASAEAQSDSPEEPTTITADHPPPTPAVVSVKPLDIAPESPVPPTTSTTSMRVVVPYRAEQERPSGGLASPNLDRSHLTSHDASRAPENSVNSSFPIAHASFPILSNIASLTAILYPVNNQVAGSPPATSSSIMSDGVFVPGSEFREFHNRLRDGMLNTNAGEGHVPPSRPLSTGIELTTPLTPLPLPRQQQEQSPDYPPTSLGTVGLLTHELEAQLWKNWIDEVSTWIDKFDPHRHFRHTLPMMAQDSAHLRYSILALSARQLEMRDKILPEELSLTLYQEAIHGVLPALETRDTAVIASCVVLCVLEMLSCSPNMWRRHLDGCANLITTLNIRGDSGGVEQALFWCIVRMDVCGTLIHPKSTLVPVDRWTSNACLADDIDMFASATAFEQHANHALLLLAHVQALAIKPWVSNVVAEWTTLLAHLQSWSARRPAKMKPVVKRASQPFDTLIFTNGAAISGNQLYHTAMVLLLLRRPDSIPLPTTERSILWHARRICAISLSNAHHGCWTNSIQPLWVAGHLMSHASEHEALLGLLRSIEVETGWATAWRARDLQAYWGV